MKSPVLANVSSLERRVSSGGLWDTPPLRKLLVFCTDLEAIAFYDSSTVAISFRESQVCYCETDLPAQHHLAACLNGMTCAPVRSESR